MVYCHSGTLFYSVMVIQTSTEETVRNLTTTDSFVTLNSLSCCEKYFFTVFAGVNSTYYGDSSMLSFQTRPDLSGKCYCM